ncbi:shikimate dehydrogenase [Leptospira borgpetersenii]|uniref:shikimate dehydrogenase n=1 Tax=Leptospira borgpetersenii TaxID=174 RepID=UPI0007737B74|nr:shikimate dehydrogenase [Leptospira borgpetersenii]MBE8363908.1 shikimate dehydrogenase [Leptospira borgpetersenii serovar Balcanica]MBE8369023.1 shikimate dehydrogenase [Leptospira borgpetersenii serovar Balcanica]MBE8422970.1 shikimate dehydrogenase [Leptospira borgpetersenii serovar Balcanica]MBF3350045.1 shikimate dehydrogenase [Leptospira borgpetersenii serovar Balcanica]
MNSKTNQTAKTFGIVGFPLSHSLSPLIHNSIYKDRGIDASYLVFETPELNSKTIQEFRNSGILGLSVTIPHKEKAFLLADKADSTSTIMKASNTLLIGPDSIHAYNTDGEGAYRSILELSPESLNVGNTVILGSGGSARGIAYNLAASGKIQNLFLCSRNEMTAKEICFLISKNSNVKMEHITQDSLFSRKEEISLVIHTTPLGMKGQAPGPFLSEKFFNPNMTLFDIVYNPLETPLVKAAKKAGAKIIPGSEMLLHQAMKQFELFTGISPNAIDILKTRERLSQTLTNQ